MNKNLNEKVSVNINPATLSQIDLLVDKGYYSNRSDFINQALRDELQKYASVFEQVKQEKEVGETWFLGISNLDNRTLQNAKAQGKRSRWRATECWFWTKTSTRSCFLRSWKRSRCAAR